MRFTTMFHYGRCGSKILARLVEALSETTFLPELCFYDEVKGWGPLGDLRVHDNSRVNGRWMHAGIAAEVAKLKKGPEHPVIGELTDSDIRFSRLDCDFLTIGAFLRDMQSDYVVHLRRRNTLKLILSHAIAHATNVWHLDAKRTDPVRVTLEIKWLRREIYSRWQRERTVEHSLAATGVKVVDCVYEDRLEKDPVAGALWFMEELDIPVTKSLPDQLPLGKTNPFPAFKNIENLKEVEDLLAEFACEWMLY